MKPRSGHGYWLGFDLGAMGTSRRERDANIVSKGPRSRARNWLQHEEGSTRNYIL